MVLTAVDMLGIPDYLCGHLKSGLGVGTPNRKSHGGREETHFILSESAIDGVS